MEMALLSPWVFLLAIGALDWGFYGYALISMQASVRSAMLYASTDVTTAVNTTAACNIVLGEMRSLPNIGNSTTTCTSNPVVTASLVTGPDAANAARISVQYTSISLIPIPGLLTKQFTLTRVATMRIRG